MKKTKKLMALLLACAMIPAYTATAAEETKAELPAIELEEQIPMPEMETENMLAIIEEESIVSDTMLIGSGTEEDPFLISNLDEMIAFQEEVDNGNSFAGQYVKLTSDIDLTDVDWNPIGSESCSFEGVFDGDNHTVSNVTVNKDEACVGFFAKIKKNAGTPINSEIKNVLFDNISVKSPGKNYVGGVVGNAFVSNITNVHVNGIIEIEGNGYVGGIVGHGYVKVTDSSVKAEGTVTSHFWAAGGIVGLGGEGTTNITNTIVEGTGKTGLTITSAAGGLGSVVGLATTADNMSQFVSGSDLSVSNVTLKTVKEKYGDKYATYCFGYFFGGDNITNDDGSVKNLTGNLNAENITFETFSGSAPTSLDIVAKIVTENTTVYYASLAAAFTAVNAMSGAETVTLTISAGEFAPTANEQLRIERANVVIEGAGADKTTIALGEYSCSGQAGILIGADNVTLKNLAVTSSSSDGNAAAVKATYLGADGARQLQNCVLENLTISSEKSHGLNIHGVNICTITNVNITKSGKCAVALANAKDVTLTGSTLNGNWGDIGMMYSTGAGYDNPCELTLGANNTFGKGLIYADPRTDGAVNTVNLQAEQNVDIFGAQVMEGENKLTTKVAAAKTTVEDRTVYYADLQSAIEDAQENAVITLLKDFTVNEPIDVNKSVTIDGLKDGKKVKVTSNATRILWITKSGAEVNLKNIEFVSSTAERGVQVNVDIKDVALNIDNCVIPGTYYAINMCNGTNTTLNIKNSTITGWGALNLWGNEYHVTVTDSTLIGINDKGYNADGWNDFSTVVLEGDTTGATDDHVEKCSVVLNNCHIIAKQTTGNKQKAIGFNSPSANNHVVITGDKTVVEYEDDLFCISGSDTNKLEVYAGTFPTSVCGYVAATSIQKIDGDKFVVRPLGEGETTEQSHIWNDGEETKTATCTENGEKTFVCTVCGATKTEKTALLPHTVVTDPAVAPTCTTTGLTEGEHCSVCNTVLKEQTTVAALGHTVAIDAAVVPTCTTTGLTEGEHCSVCNTVLKEQTTVAALGHTEVIDEAIPATCTTAGKTAGKHCSVCNEVLEAQEVIPALGHNYVYTANRNVITETCANGCDHSATATITAEGGRENGSDYTASIAYSENWAGNKDAAIVYTSDGETVTATRSAGEYTATVTIGDAAASVTFSVTARRTSSSGRPSSGGNVTTIVSKPNNEVNINDGDVPLADADSVITAGAADGFTDVQPNDWYYDAVNYVCGQKLMNGMEQNLFGVNNVTTRGMIVTILHRLEGEPTAEPAGFTDVEPGQYYANAIAWAAENGIVEGYDSTTFGPDNSITREQFAAILYRYAAHKGYNVANRADITGYTDTEQVSAYATDAMQWAVAEKLISGMTETTLVPNGDAVRVQAAAILARFCQNIAK